MQDSGGRGGAAVDLTVVLTTTESDGQARALARALLESGLAACVQLSRIDSLYRWQGEIEEAPEIRVLIKTRRALRDRVLAFVREHHPYDEPQLVALDADAVSEGYLAWLLEATDAESPQR
jgi:periplasmic divalent cation tolerance protein